MFNDLLSITMIKLFHGSYDSIINTLVQYERDDGMFHTTDGCRVTSNFMNIFCTSLSIDFLIAFDNINVVKKSQKIITYITNGMKMTYDQETHFFGSCIVCETVFEANYWFYRYRLLTNKSVLAIKSKRKSIPRADVIICPRIYVNLIRNQSFYRVVYTTHWLKNLNTSSQISSLFSYALMNHVENFNDLQCFRLQMKIISKPFFKHFYYVTQQKFNGKEWNFTQKYWTLKEVCCQCLKHTKSTLKLECFHIICKDCLMFKVTECDKISLVCCHVCKKIIYNTKITRLVDSFPKTKTLTEVRKEVFENAKGKTIYFDLDVKSTKTYTQKTVLNMMSQETCQGIFHLSPFADLPSYLHYQDIETVIINQTFQPTAVFVKKMLDLFCYNRSQAVNIIILHSKTSFIKKWKSQAQHVL